jgi:hypothetical protein
MKHLIYFEQLFESIERNAIVLIKGKPKKGKKKLYAAHVLGSIEVRPGAEMMFLSDVFYRIEWNNGELRGVRVGWQNEEELRDSLNLRSPNKISVVKNNNKTPFHWKTTKHTHLRDALDSVQGMIDLKDYDF